MPAVTRTFLVLVIKQAGIFLVNVLTFLAQGENVNYVLLVKACSEGNVSKIVI